MAHSGQNADRPDLGSLLRGYRMRSGFTQAELAGRAGLSVRGLRDLESGRSSRPHPASIRRLADALRLSPDERALLDRPAAPPPVPAPGTSGAGAVGILGPLVIMLDGHQTAPGAPMLRCLLGLLALHSPDPVPVDEIMTEVWGDRPPPTARRQVHVRIGELRRLLGTDRVESVTGGYRLRGALDASTFRALATTAGHALTDGDHAGAGDAYARALRLWRGPVLADVPVLRHHPVVASLTARRIEATVAYAGLVDDAGRPEVLRWLRALAADEPLHEGLAASLMLTLAAGGEREAALAVHDVMRARLRDELGIGPGPELRDAHLRVRGEAPAPRPAADRPADELAALARVDEALTAADAAHRWPDDPAGHARVILDRARIAGLLGDGREALGHTERALALFEALDDRPGTARALAAAGRHLIGLGEADRALDVLARAWAIHADLDDPHGRADTLDQLGRAHLLRGDPDTAAGHFRQAAALHRDLGDRYAEADAHHWLGDAHEAMGDVTGARAGWSSALRILDEIGHDDAAGVRRKLTASPSAPAPGRPAPNAAPRGSRRSYRAPTTG